MLYSGCVTVSISIADYQRKHMNITASCYIDLPLIVSAIKYCKGASLCLPPFFPQEIESQYQTLVGAGSMLSRAT